MTIYYSCDKNRKLEVSVNETKTEIKDLNSGNKEKVTSVTIPVSMVSYPSGSISINWSALASFAASQISLSVASSFPYRIFSLIVPVNRWVS